MRGWAHREIYARKGDGAHRKWSLKAMLAGVALAVAAATLAAGCGGGGEDLEGRWEGAVSYPDQTADVELVLEQDGQQLSGSGTIDTADGEQVSLTELKGELSEDGSVTVTYEPGTGAQWTFDGEVEGDTIDGKFLDNTLSESVEPASFTLQRQ